MSVLDNMMLAATGQTGEKIFTAWFAPWIIRKQERANREKAMELLELFNLTEKKDDYAATLSGGQRKLLELARALMMDPKMILLDEPMAGVNPTLGSRLLEHVGQLRDEGMTFVLVEHDMDVVMNVSERVIVMANGKVITEGTPDEVRTQRRSNKRLPRSRRRSGRNIGRNLRRRRGQWLRRCSKPATSTRATRPR